MGLQLFATSGLGLGFAVTQMPGFASHFAYADAVRQNA